MSSPYPPNTNPFDTPFWQSSMSHDYTKSFTIGILFEVIRKAIEMARIVNPENNHVYTDHEIIDCITESVLRDVKL